MLTGINILQHPTCADVQCPIERVEEVLHVKTIGLVEWLNPAIACINSGLTETRPFPPVTMAPFMWQLPLMFTLIFQLFPCVIIFHARKLNCE